MIIKISTGIRWHRKDLQFFSDMRLVNARPFRTLVGADKEEVNKKNRNFAKLFYSKRLSDNQKRDLEDLICDAWNEYVNIYDTGFMLKLKKRMFRCNVYEDSADVDKKSCYLGVKNGLVYDLPGIR